MPLLPSHHHLCTMPIDHVCLSCSKTFDTVAGLRSHAKAKRHTANPYICDDCEMSYVSLSALQSHMNSPKHAYDYPSNRENTYMEEGNSASDSDPYCNGCERHFMSTDDLNNHLVSSPRHNWCFDCSRDFWSATSLEQHRNSLAHHEREIQCPLCRSMFKSPSGIALHLESGCHQFTRLHVTATLQGMQIVPVIPTKRIADVRPLTLLRAYAVTEASSTRRRVRVLPLRLGTQEARRAQRAPDLAGSRRRRVHVPKVQGGVRPRIRLPGKGGRCAEVLSTI
ncbi:hypothetical protein HYPSUDRAFT_91836 [Hypholoma sublateritium FD-334 SS-4]|uniref:C2H2-type domain-containing protein n=1 Tax=Hypholoma sublateritium (strain FD-334 SS-4) TaxID=945553 RepID=A0A0D2KLM1_HYPSF|nr:hypothetical protein HYPSUDRAFT_91836 [Hypholoma sublateritium FD-334 SS-4]